jgi:hypothetical protein
MATIGGEIQLPGHPLAIWDDDDCSHPRLVWWAQLDGRYLVEVARSAGPGCRAHLRLFDHDRDDLPLSDQVVELADDAMHGPAVEDVAAWQATAIGLVDAIEARKGSRRGPRRQSRSRTGVLGPREG